VHVLRHTAAKLRRDVRESIEDLSRFLDHSNLAVETTYLRHLKGEQDDRWRKLAALIGRLGRAWGAWVRVQGYGRRRTA
jgi:hypothetical protein